MRSLVAALAALAIGAAMVAAPVFGFTSHGGVKSSSSSPTKRGPQGPRGARGPRGHTGAAGATGAPGPQGLQGPAGTNGVDVNGIKGDQGPQGPKGDKGDPGAVSFDGIQTRSNSVSPLSTSGTNLSVNCQSNEHILNGGYWSSGATITESEPSGNGWSVTARADGSSSFTYLSVQAICVPG